MAQLFTSLYQMAIGVTNLDTSQMNTRWQSIDDRLNFLELNNVLTFFVPGGLVVGNTFRFPWPFRGQNVSIGLAVNTAPVGSALLFQLEVGGTDVFLAAERPTIADGSQFGTYSVNGSSLASFSENNQAIFQIDQVGSGTPGSDLSVIIRPEKILI